MAVEPQINSYQKEVLPFLTQYCFECHGNGKAKADLSFDNIKDDATVLADRKTWDSIQHMLETHEMPPEKKKQPKLEEVDAALAAIRGIFERYDRTAKPNPGRVTMRRLNKTEYNNTIRDLIGVDFKPANDFPADDVGYGFDNIGDVLSVTPLLMEKYLTAAEQIMEQAIVIVDPPKPSKSAIGAVRVNATSTSNDIGGTVSFDEGEYIIRAKVYGDQVGDEPIRMVLRVNDEDVKEFTISATKSQPTTVEIRKVMPAGTNKVSVALLNPFRLPSPSTGPTTRGSTSMPAVASTAAYQLAYQWLEPASAATVVSKDSLVPARRFRQPVPQSDGRTRILFLQAIDIEGPFNPPPPPLSDGTRKLLAHSPNLSPRDAAREIIARFASRAYRRSVKPDEVDACLAIYDKLEKKGIRFELCIRGALYRILVSPHFLFRVELDPANAKTGDNYLVNEYELASRLSYFLWNSTPDDELLALAGKGQLRENLDAQVSRLIQDPRSKSFLYGFAEQWLTLRKLDLSSPDPKQFPNFTPLLRDSMIKESDLFFEAIVRENHSIIDLLEADFTFVNVVLARHYGIPDVRGLQFTRVKAPANRAGILTQASILTLTSNATRTSPVKRGKFVLEQILNTPPPPPPPDIPALEEQKQLTGTLRQVMEQHRANPTCASCHQKMDPIGFSFEHYDATGNWRDTDGKSPIDASGTLPDGKKFDGADGLKEIIKSKKSLFIRCVTEKMLTYATGRGLEYYDRRAVDKIMGKLEKQEYRFNVLLTEIVKSDPFQMRSSSGVPQ